MAEIPETNLSWIAVAQDMGHQRSRLDYLRRWGVLRHHILYGWGVEGVRSSEVSRVVRSAHAKRAMAANMALLRAKSITVLEGILSLYVQRNSLIQMLNYI